MILLAASTIFAQENAKAPTVGQPDVLSKPDRALEISTLVESMRAQWQVPGLSVAVVKDDRVVLSRGFGVTQVGGTESVDADTLFAIASNTKAFTSAALAILVDEKKLGWNDHVSDYLPWLKMRDPFATQDLRIRDLLCHRSGLGTFSGDLLWWGTEYTPKEVLQRAAILEPASSLRSEYGYSNLMFLAAGEIVTKVVEKEGLDWGSFVRTRILEPLCMSRTVTSTNDLEGMGNLSTPHKTFVDHSQPIEWINWDTMAAAGGIISSSNDMSHWLRLQLRKGRLGERDIFTRRQATEMWRAHMPIALSSSYSN